MPNFFLTIKKRKRVINESQGGALSWGRVAIAEALGSGQRCLGIKEDHVWQLPLFMVNFMVKLRACGRSHKESRDVSLLEKGS